MTHHKYEDSRNNDPKTIRLLLTHTKHSLCYPMFASSHAHTTHAPLEHVFYVLGFATAMTSRLVVAHKRSLASADYSRKRVLTIPHKSIPHSARSMGRLLWASSESHLDKERERGHSIAMSSDRDVVQRACSRSTCSRTVDRAK